MSAGLELRRAAPTDPDAVALAAAQRTDVGGTHPSPSMLPDEPLAELLAPGDRLLVGHAGGAPAAVGAVRVIEPGVAEVKRMYVAPEWRGRGFGRTLLAALEREAAEMGCTLVRLDTAETQSSALALYRSSGYVEIPDYNGNAAATHWFEKRLGA